MGLFSDEEVIYVATSVQRVIPDNRIISSLETGTLKAIFAHGDIADYVLEDLVNGIGLRSNRYWHYGRDKYAYGLPSAQTVVPYSTNNAQVQSVLEQQEGQSVTIEYSYSGLISYKYLAQTLLYAQYPQYDFDTKILNFHPFINDPIYLQRFVLKMSTATRNTLVDANLYALEDDPEVMIDDGLPVGQIAAIIWKGTEPGLNGASTITQLGLFNTASYVTNADYFQVKYRVNSTRKFFTYQIGSGQYPNIDAVYAPGHLPNGTYFPFGYFRYNRTPMDANKSDPGYITSKRLMRRIGLQYDSMITSIHQNPQITDVEQAMLFMAIPPETNEPIEQRYLFTYFNNLFFDLNGITETRSADQTDYDYLNNPDPSIAGAVVIQDARFRMALTHQGLFRRVVAGSIGPVNTYRSVKYMAFDTIPVHLFQHQISANQYTEIQIHQMAMKYYVFENYFTTNDGTTNALLIPLDLSITQHLPLKDRERLYTRSLHYVFNSKTVVTLAWYQQDFFQFLVVVAAVVIAVYTGQEGFVAWAEGIAAGTITVEAALYAVAVKLVDAVIAQFLIKIFIKAVGVDIALIVAIIALAYGYGEALQNGLKNLPPLAQNLLTAGNGLIKGISGYYKDAIQEITEDIQGIQDQAKLFNDEVQKVQDELYASSRLTPFINVSETPEQYFNRTVHSGNIGMIGIDAVSNFVERSLSLPTLTNPFGEVA